MKHLYIEGSVNLYNVDFEHVDSTSKMCVDGSVAFPPNNVKIHSNTINNIDFEKYCGGTTSEGAKSSLLILSNFLYKKELDVTHDYY